jgi:hypothetical protein
MGKMYFQATMLTLAYILASTANAGAGPDAQGWSGPGWYITGSAPPSSQAAAAPDYILFEGPHELQSACLEVYDRFFSPIGVCRLLNAKPVAFTG